MVEIQTYLQDLMLRFGDLGVFIAMFLESSIVPIPSEIVIIGAGAVGIPIHSIVIFGSIGSTFGAIVGYAIGRYAAMPIILKFSKYLFIKQHHIDKALGFSKKYGVWGVLIGRVLPIIPFKVFSLASGITKIPLVPFIVFTAIGVVPRMYLLSMFGHAAVKYTNIAVLVVAVVGGVYVLYRIIKNKKAKTVLRVSEKKEDQPEKCEVVS